MAQTADPVVIALIATLEARALKKGKKSLLKQIVSRLDKVTALDLIASIADAQPAKIETPAKRKPAERAKMKASTKVKPTATPKKAKAKTDDVVLRS